LVGALESVGDLEFGREIVISTPEVTEFKQTKHYSKKAAQWTEYDVDNIRKALVLQELTQLAETMEIEELDLKASTTSTSYGGSYGGAYGGNYNTRSTGYGATYSYQASAQRTHQPTRVLCRCVWVAHPAWPHHIMGQRQHHLHSQQQQQCGCHHIMGQHQRIHHIMDHHLVP